MEDPTYRLEGIVKNREEMQDFEGPLSLILMLLSKNKIEIRDIKISEILEQYLAGGLEYHFRCHAGVVVAVDAVVGVFDYQPIGCLLVVCSGIRTLAQPCPEQIHCVRWIAVFGVARVVAIGRAEPDYPILADVELVTTNPVEREIEPYGKRS